MIIAKIHSGLGNQLFQYAFGRALALRNHDVFKLDTSWYTAPDRIGHDASRFPNHNDGYVDPYFLGYFNVVENIASEDEIGRAKYPLGAISVYWTRLIEKLRNSRLPARLKQTLGLSELYVGFVPRMLKRKRGGYFDGYWQSEKYFSDQADLIRREFTLKNPMTEASRAALEKITSEKDCVSVHIRRGLIAQIGDSHPFWGISTKEYVYRAIDYIVEKLGYCPHIFVFSDSVEAAKKDVPMNHPATYVSSPLIPDHEELILMSSCKNNIIANSTFGWWAGWLNANPDKIVIAPKVWAKKDLRLFEHLIPEGWIRI